MYRLNRANKGRFLNKTTINSFSIICNYFSTIVKNFSIPFSSCLFIPISPQFDGSGLLLVGKFINFTLLFYYMVDLLLRSFVLQFYQHHVFFSLLLKRFLWQQKVQLFFLCIIRYVLPTNLRKIDDCILVLANSINQLMRFGITFRANWGIKLYLITSIQEACLKNCLLFHFKTGKLYYLPHTSSRQKLLLTLISKKREFSSQFYQQLVH